MDSVVALSARDRGDVFRVAATKLQSQLNVSPLVLEKDFWVCWTLARVFAVSDAPALIFKGGTSLSKGYNLIKRFSEDIDLVFDRRWFNVKDPRDEAIGSNERARRCDVLVGTCNEYVANRFLPNLRSSFQSVLGQTQWSISIDEKEPSSLIFTYPASLTPDDYGGGTYIKPAVRLEFGIRGEHTPSEKKDVAPYISAANFDTLKVDSVNVTILHPKRTFWEKILIHHRSSFKPPNEDKHRHSRHSYDLAMMAASWVAEEALTDRALFQDVIEHERLMFRRAPKEVYDAASSGAVRIVPISGDQMESLRRDYRNMEPMFFGEPPTFESIVLGLRQLEERVAKG